ncbi:MAG: HD domain-containing protein [Oligoflexia bacterium]|nr:HD domain-containing protein [Oligoflexia bacterium]
MTGRYVSITLNQLLVDEPLPGTVYLNIDGRFLAFRAGGDAIDRNTFDRLQFKNVTNLFVLEQDFTKFAGWTVAAPSAPASEGPEPTPENRELVEAWKDTHRKTLDIFQSTHPDHHIAGVMNSSRKVVSEITRSPFAVQSLTQLQTFSKGTVDHSVNVAVLAVYLGMQMGYTSSVILQNVALGGILHDLGKRKVDVQDSDTPEAAKAKLREHPTLGLRILETMEQVPNEVKLIVAQHHEFHDGTGYPKKLRNTAIYDLARIVAIANTFDRLVSEGRGTLAERQRSALMKFDERFFSKFDADKHDKCVRILKLGI